MFFTDSRAELPHCSEDAYLPPHLHVGYNLFGQQTPHLHVDVQYLQHMQMKVR